jgi:hypothetical protein
MTLKHFQARAKDWERLCSTRRIKLDIIDGFLDIGLAWRRVSRPWKEMLWQSYRDRHTAREERIQRHEPEPQLPPGPAWGNVIAFRR